jgi:hypothetical protein
MVDRAKDMPIINKSLLVPVINLTSGMRALGVFSVAISNAARLRAALHDLLVREV